MSATKKEEGHEWEHIPMGPCMCMHVDVGEHIAAVRALVQMRVSKIVQLPSEVERCPFIFEVGFLRCFQTNAR